MPARMRRGFACPDACCRGLGRLACFSLGGALSPLVSLRCRGSLPTRIVGVTSLAGQHLWGTFGRCYCSVAEGFYLPEPLPLWALAGWRLWCAFTHRSRLGVFGCGWVLLARTLVVMGPGQFAPVRRFPLMFWSGRLVLFFLCRSRLETRSGHASRMPLDHAPTGVLVGAILFGSFFVLLCLST